MNIYMYSQNMYCETNPPTNYASRYIVGRCDEDRHTIVTLVNGIQMYMICDGHAGKTVVDHVHARLPEKFNEVLNGDIDFFDEQLMKKVITNVFMELDAEMEKEWMKFSSGSTANVVLRKGSKMYIANIADSRSIIFDSTGCILLETIDHDCENEKEVKRITDMGGDVIWGRVRGMLAVTRAFGDFSYKVHPSDTETYDHHGEVSVIPDIYVHNIEPHSSTTLLMASDGLWNGLYKDSIKVVEMIQSISPSLYCDDLEAVCDIIATKGKENYNPTISKDDITVILVSL